VELGDLVLMYQLNHHAILIDQYFYVMLTLIVLIQSMFDK